MTTVYQLGPVTELSSITRDALRADSCYHPSRWYIILWGSLNLTEAHGELIIDKIKADYPFKFSVNAIYINGVMINSNKVREKYMAIIGTPLEYAKAEDIDITPPSRAVKRHTYALSGKEVKSE